MIYYDYFLLFILARPRSWCFTPFVVFYLGPSPFVSFVPLARPRSSQ